MLSVVRTETGDGEKMADPETERAIGRIEGRLETLAARVSEVVNTAMERIEKYDRDARSNTDALWVKVNDLTEKVGNLRAAAANSTGAMTASQRAIDLAFKVAPWLAGGGLGAAFVTALLRK